MDEICPQLWLTDIRTVMTEDISEHDHVITVCEEDVSDLVEPNNYQFELLPATGKAGPPPTDHTFKEFNQAVDTVVQHLSDGDSIVTHCHSGTSRSVAVAAAALARYDDIEFESALKTIQCKRPTADPSERYLNYAKRHLKANRPTA